jgi:hypothetical protein
MAANTELKRIGHFHGGIETTPEDNAKDKDYRSASQRSSEYL